MRVAVVGLGKMGSALVRRLLDQGVEVVVWNRTPAAAAPLVSEGAEQVDRLAAVWSSSTTVCSFLADDEAVQQVCLGEHGLVASAPPGAFLLEMSTISPAASARLAEAASGHRLAYLRSPVSGNPQVLAAGNLTLIVSGERSAFEASRPLLELVGPTVLYVGDADQARTMKLAVNAMLAATAEALAEAVLLCEASGIDRAVALEVLGRSAVASPFVGYKRQALLDRRYQATFTTAMLLKDLELVAGTAAATGLQLPLAALVEQLAAAACEEGLGDLDFLALLPHLQALAGRPTDVPVGSTGA
ncbi:MAG TPA: NAD(P)-dependent oxidoreductase [Acidimicrobiales bacterium]|nr:NAD(P)-dependent oxidoreductase [Acidimicrobiales bacterium]